MNQKISKTRGNFSANGDFFPLDAGYLEELERNSDLVAILGALADGGGAVGTGYILRGCDTGATPGTINDGYIFLRSTDYPSGEVLYFTGGSKTTNISIQEDAIAATGGSNPPVTGAYRHRYLRPSVAGDTALFSWGNLPRAGSITATAQKNTEQDADIAALRNSIADMRPPIGTVHMWAAPSVKPLPAGYLPCDGRALTVAAYGELYAILGDHYGANAAKTEYNLPDMRGLFVTGQKAGEGDYSDPGKKGGEATHRLTKDEMPAHCHRQGSHSLWSSYREEGGYTGDYAGDYGYPVGGAPSYTNAPTSTVGGGAAHENRPPYIVMTYIIRVK